jgi:lysophospholipase L1-like esterase
MCGRLLQLTLLLVAATSLSGCHLYRSVRLYEQHWAQPQGTSGGLRYVALGDSAAQGIGASSPERGYVGLLAERLREASGKPIQVINISRSGAKLEDVVKDQLPRVWGLQPDVVTVDVGGNDIADWDAARFAVNAAALCAGLPGGKTVVADVPSFMHGRWRQRSLEAARILTQACQSRGLSVAQLHSSIESHGIRGMFTLYAADWFHPNDRGYRVWADAFWSELQQLVR